MHLPLFGRGLEPLGPTSGTRFVGRIAADPSASGPREVLFLASGPSSPPAGFRSYLTLESLDAHDLLDAFLIPPEMGYLAPGDIVRIDPGRRSLSVLYRRGSGSNSLLVTERCDNYCLMCSQPPKEADDAWLIDELQREVIPLMSRETAEVGITGGEPALLGNRLVALLAQLEHELPRTAVHVLSNGRRFADAAFAHAIGGVAHHDLMLGIPLYSDLPEEHDFVVQARGAFDETVRGILNLKRAGVRVEMRFVIHRETYGRMREFAEFVARNLVFLDHVAIMGLEPTGFAKTNIDQLWIDPLDYQAQLAAAVRVLAGAGLPLSIYNLPLCVLPLDLRRFARRSISDWKNIFFDECEPCAAKSDCAGFFASARVRRTRSIVPIRAEEHGAP